MVRELIHDPIFLSAESESATSNDADTARDLLDTLTAHKTECVGMAANMIGVRKRIIAFLDESEQKEKYTVMFNPEIIKKSGAYEAEEGCLSLLGGPRKCRRYKNIKVRFMNTDMQVRIKSYNRWTAQIIQHEIDHCNGILI
jgi:peptide deformylase